MRWLLTVVALLFTTGSLAQGPSAQTSRSSERVTCSIAAGMKFGIPANIVLAIAQVEGGRPGQWVRNRNGTYDVGAMQFNTRYLEHLERRYGITPADVAATGCYSYDLAAWRLRKHLEFDRGDEWTRVANYHSRSPAENERYRAKVIRAAAKWARWLSERFGADALREASAVLVEVRSRKAELRQGQKRNQLITVASRADDGENGGDDTAILHGLIGDGAALLRQASAPKRATTRARLRQAADPAATNDEREHSALLELLKE